MGPISSSRRRSSRWRWALLPVVLLFAAVALLLGSEFRASRLLRREVAAIRAAGLPDDDQSLSQDFFNFTSQDQTVAWREVSVAMAHLEHRASNEYGFPYSSWDGTDYPGLPLFLKDAAPVIARIDRLSQDVKPTWQPVAFSGLSTLLPDVHASRQIHRLLHVEFNHAVDTRDSKRALRALQLDAATSEAYDWQLVRVTDQMNMGTHVARHDRIRRSLALELWNEEHLASLSVIVGEQRDITHRWRRILANERAMYAAHLSAHSGNLFVPVLTGWDSKNQNIVLPASIRLAALRQMNGVIGVAEQGYVGLKHRIQFAAEQAVWPMPYRVVRKWVGGPQDFNRLTSSLTAGVEQYAAWFMTFEDSRRLTRTAIAVKQYQLRNKKWASNLSDLQTVGLPVQEGKMLNGHAFDYRIESNQSQAVLRTGGEVAESQLSVVTIR